MTKVFTLKNDKSFTAPSLFVNPQSSLDIAALWKANDAYGLPHIDGLFINLTDYKRVFHKLRLENRILVDSKNQSIHDKVVLLDPSFNLLLSGTDEQKQKMLQTDLFDPKVAPAIEKISHSELSTSEKTRLTIEEVFPYLQVRPAIELQIKMNADMIISPCVSLTSQKKFREQVAKAREMLIDSRVLLDTSFKSYSETHELMNIVAIHKDIVKENNFAALYELLSCNDPDHIGIKLVGVSNEGDSVFLELWFQFLRQLTYYLKLRDKQGSIGLHLVNVDEMGYVGYCHGICNIVSPIATLPYPVFSARKHSDDEGRDFSGMYYHPTSMNYPKLSTIDKLPCSCKVCKKYQKVSGMSEEERRIFRRMHWLICKDEEIRQLRTTPVRLDLALRDKFARSMRTQLVAYIPVNPVFAVYK